ncbi:ANTAR domain-containing protein [Streptomyces sp. 549]|uniref:ANTAR domain-containing protein n=1 Tax=Streptomyces sp. 549 TaxID=3049076 RepID=UPI0024C23299|nr:ANTAR domain-containing protein [Streptomyces sp. 549]MDK1472118.1 ANTAR domain-containing protein [Streptomyces sp. 549]
MPVHRQGAPSADAGRAGVDEPEGGSTARSLALLAERVAQASADCWAVAVTVSDGTAQDDPLGNENVALTHPDLSALLDVERRVGDGPVTDALATGELVGSSDLLEEERWGAYRARALDLGLRSVATLPCGRDGLVITLSLHGVRPRAPHDAVDGVMGLLGDLTVSELIRDHRHRERIAQVEQLDAALRRRPVIDQACGIIMHISGCDAGEAFLLLRRLSQASNRKLSEVAEGVVRSRGRGLESQLRRLHRMP